MLIQVLIFFNDIANAVGSVLLAPVEYLPGWVSATAIAVMTGVAMLFVFKHTSNQKAIKRTRDQIKANLLAISLFNDNLRVSLRCQARLFFRALVLLSHSLLPIAVMSFPMILVLGQIALWYQARPLAVGEESIVTVHLKPGDEDGLKSIDLSPSESVKVLTGPVRVKTKDMVCWNVVPTSDGRHHLEFTVDGLVYKKEFMVGGEFKPISEIRPSRSWNTLLIHPREQPFAADSRVQSIEVTYPDRRSYVAGTNHWIIYWFVVSMIAAFVAKPFLKVNI